MLASIKHAMHRGRSTFLAGSAHLAILLHKVYEVVDCWPLLASMLTSILALRKKCKNMTDKRPI